MSYASSPPGLSEPLLEISDRPSAQLPAAEKGRLVWAASFCEWSWNMPEQIGATDL
jgi:hypothetical protein